MHCCDTLILSRHVITQNPQRDILEDGAIAIKNGIIEAVGDSENMRRHWQPQNILDLGNSIILPGLVNAHAHAAMTFLRGLADDLPLMSWLEKHIFPVEARLTPEITFMGSMLGHAEMLSTGITSCVDMYIFEEAVFRAARATGIRCLGGEAVFAFPSAACATPERALEITEELAELYRGDERLSVAVNPHSVYTTTPQILTDCLELAAGKDLPLHIHLAETVGESTICQERQGKRPITYCADLGLFEARVLAAHLVDVTDDEIDLLARAGVCGIHNPSSNMKLASGISPVCKMLEKGVTMGLGTDGPASNNQINLFTEMSRAALLQKLGQDDPAALPAGTVLDMATLGGAKIMGDSRLGSLESGKAADIIALDGDAINLLPMHNPVSQCVYAATGHECRMTMVGGEILYRDGKFTRFDISALKKEAKSLTDFVDRANG